MVQLNRTAEDVADMETELYHLRRDLAEAQRELTVCTTERTSLKIEVALLTQKADDRLTKLTRIETMVTGLASSLFAQLKEIREERELAQAVRRQAQENALEVGSTNSPAPEFLQQRRAPLNEEERDTGRVRTRPREISPRDDVDAAEQLRRSTAEEDHAFEREEQDKRDRLRGAAERIAMAPPAVRPSPPLGRPSHRPIDHTLAERDSRLPKYDYEPQRPPTAEQQDVDNLRQLSDRIG